MKIKVLGFIETIIMSIVLVVVWFTYNSYFLTQNSDGSYNFINNGRSTVFLIGAITVTAIILFCFGYRTVRFCQRWLNKKASSKIMSKLSQDLSRLYLDDNFTSHCRQFGITMNYDSISIKPEILAKCHLDYLARLIVFIFHKNISSSFDFDKIFYSLADLIIESWSEEVVQEFVQYVYSESIVLGEQLKYAIDRQKVNREVAEFNESIESRLAAIEKTHQEKSLATIIEIDSQFKYHGYLANGGSALGNWLREKNPFGNLWKPAIVK